VKRTRLIVEWVADFCGHFSGWLILAIVGLVFFEVFMRYVINQPPGLVDEFSGYMMVGLSFLGAAYTWKERGHIRITFIITRLPPKTRSYLRLATLILVFLFMVSQVFAGYGFLERSFKYNMSANTWLFTPLQGPHITMVIGLVIFLLILLVAVVRAVANIREGKSSEEVG
jgi:TRAP-type C4-dicarboxylate transport system permease small subunit